jgi:hypothetical protein
MIANGCEGTGRTLCCPRAPPRRRRAEETPAPIISASQGDVRARHRSGSRQSAPTSPAIGLLPPSQTASLDQKAFPVSIDGFCLFPDCSSHAHGRHLAQGAWTVNGELETGVEIYYPHTRTTR